MTKPTDTTRSVVIERQLSHPPEKIWRALTQGPLIEEWLMKNDFQPVVGSAAQWSGPGRIRTYDQGIHLSPTFPPGVDYLFTRA
jgi:uncharacterized protein YndB with AHSA1/START domain